jgi:hypothetical protein
MCWRRFRWNGGNDHYSRKSAPKHLRADACFSWYDNSLQPSEHLTWTIARDLRSSSANQGLKEGQKLKPGCDRQLGDLIHANLVVNSGEIWAYRPPVSNCR